MHKNVLLEIGTEEIPARFMSGILAQMKEKATEILNDEKITFSEINSYGTPRRLVLQIKEIAAQQEDMTEINKGPSVSIAFDAEGKPTKAAQGFARGQGIDVNDLVTRDNYVFAEIQHKGDNTEDLLPSLFTAFIQQLQFPKSMRWGTQKMRFARPIRWLVALYGDKILSFEIAGVKAGNRSRGHRFLGSDDVLIPDADSYWEIMRSEYVIVNQEERRTLIRDALNKIAAENNAIVLHDEDLLEEVVHLVEYPTVLCGSFDEKYLALPDAAIITPMKDHQRYFPLRDSNGNLLPKFLTVRNGGTAYLDVVRIGNERVLRPRLADAEFFFDEDRKKSLAERYADLERVVFQEGLGNMCDKTERIQELSSYFADVLSLSEAEKKNLLRAAHLAKTDLTTAMVTEFTELQGEIGKEYALLDGENNAVAEAIREQYLPRFSGDEVPTTMLGIIISLADKLDNIVATFSRGLVPTGSQDPYALRRQAIGIIQTTLTNKVHWSLPEAIRKVQEALDQNDEKTATAVYDFITQRLRNQVLDAGIRYDIIDAVLVNGYHDIYGVYLRAMGLQNSGFVNDEELQQAMTRVLNIVSGATIEMDGKVDENMFESNEERKLYERYKSVADDIAESYRSFDYDTAYGKLRELIVPINEFFDEVIVMTDNMRLRNNRLNLLNSIAELMLCWADVRKLAG